MVYNEDLDEEIKRTQSRLWYLRNRKKTGIPYNAGRPVKRHYVTHTKKEMKMSPDKRFYYAKIHTGKYVKKFNACKEKAIQSGISFSQYFNRCYNVVEKYGTAKEKDAFNKLANATLKEME